VIDIEQLLAETPEAPPCGPNLEYDAAFLELEQGAKGKPGQEFGGTVIPPEEPDWAKVSERARSLLQRTKDLRVAVYLTRALVNTEGVSGLNNGLKLTLQLLERFWDPVHPTLDPEFDNDPTMRVNALAPLVDPEGLLRDLGKSSFLQSRSVGRILVRDVEIALGRQPAPQGAGMTLEQLTAMARAIAEEDRSALAYPEEAQQTLLALNSLLLKKVDAARVIDVKPMANILSSLISISNTVLAAMAPAQADVGGGSYNASAHSGASSSEIRNRSDVLRVLDRVCEYLERHEPTNPAPLLIRRAKRLMVMNFVEIVRDIAPEGMKQVETITGPSSQ
jgi:type VI secretion system protein ImpA